MRIEDYIRIADVYWYYMTNTYPEGASVNVRIAEELRLIRCIMERRLNHEYPQVFVDYQMEKFGTSKESTTSKSSIWGDEIVSNLCGVEHDHRQ